MITGSLGNTRSAYHPGSHLLHTPETFVRASLPGMDRVTAIVHISPAAGARFVQYTAEFEDGGRLGPSVDQRFVYLLDGQLSIDDSRLAAGDFAYLPPGDTAVIVASGQARAAVFEKAYQPLHYTHAPGRFTGSEVSITGSHLGGDARLEVRSLVPEDPGFDFRVNTMTYEPGASLAAPEVHVMEHGLLMLSGGGIYRLGSQWYPVQAGDVIWMAAYCPQWFGALGRTPAKYLIYKDWSRNPR
jgi:(S)-ureidoglycine aminohydrolase